MNTDRPHDYVAHMRQAAAEARLFVNGMTKQVFLDDRRTQQAVIMSLVVIGEASTQIIGRYPDFAERHPGVPWRAMRGMRNRITHGYFETDLDIDWATVQAALPELIIAFERVG